MLDRLLACRCGSVGRINQLRRQVRLSASGDFWDQVRGAGKIHLLTSRSFDFAAELPANVRYVGAVLDDPYWTKGRPWALPAGQDPIVLVATSSTFQNHVRGLQRIIDGLTTLSVRGIATIGLALDPTRFRATSNVSIASAAQHGPAR
jgi:hypothetical protein